MVENALRGTFLLSLFQVVTAQIPGREITCLPIKQARIALPVPSWTVGVNWKASCVIRGHLVVALRGTADLSSGDHALLMREGRD